MGQNSGKFVKFGAAIAVIVVALILAESALVAVAGAALGLSAAPSLTRTFGRIVRRSFGGFPDPVISTRTLLLATVASLVVGLLAGSLPALRASRIPLAEGLRKEA